MRKFRILMKSSKCAKPWSILVADTLHLWGYSIANLFDFAILLWARGFFVNQGT